MSRILVCYFVFSFFFMLTPDASSAQALDYTDMSLSVQLPSLVLSDSSSAVHQAKSDRWFRKKLITGSVLLSVGLAGIGVAAAVGVTHDNGALGAIYGSVIGVVSLGLATAGGAILIRRSRLKKKEHHRQTQAVLGPGYLLVRRSF